jgi:hypothetical protein
MFMVDGLAVKLGPQASAPGASAGAWMIPTNQSLASAARLQLIQDLAKFEARGLLALTIILESHQEPADVVLRRDQRQIEAATVGMIE